MTLFHKFVTALSVVLLIAGCTGTPTGYLEAPAVTSYVSEQLPQTARDGLHSFSVCSDSREPSQWFTSVMFNDGEVYHYRLNTASQSVEPIDFANLGGQPPQYAYISGRYGCLGWMGTNFEFFARGDYRVTRGVFSLNATISLPTAETPFDTQVKRQLTLAIQAVNAASLVHKTYVPAQTSWGITVKKCVPIVGRWHSQECGRYQRES